MSDIKASLGTSTQLHSKQSIQQGNSPAAWWSEPIGSGLHHEQDKESSKPYTTTKSQSSRSAEQRFHAVLDLSAKPTIHQMPLGFATLIPDTIIIISLWSYPFPEQFHLIFRCAILRTHESDGAPESLHKGMHSNTTVCIPFVYSVFMSLERHFIHRYQLDVDTA